VDRRSETHGADSSAGEEPPVRDPAVRATCHGDPASSWGNVAPSRIMPAAQVEQCAQRHARFERTLRKHGHSACMSWSA
jgi:hypothetical protein